MSKELPFFRFTVSEWLNDDISMESYLLKGVFIDVCAFYWFKDCSITKAMLEKRFSNARTELKALIKLDIIKVMLDGNVSIIFLDNQYDMLSEKRKNRQLAGKKGGLTKSSNAKAMLKQKSSYNNKDNNKDKDNNVPELFDFLEYGRTIKIYHPSFDFQIENKYKSWVQNGWKDGNNKKIKNWKLKLNSTMPYFKKDYSSTKKDPFLQ